MVGFGYLEYRVAAAERYAMKRMRRKFNMQRDIDGRAVDWRTLYMENKAQEANKGKKKAKRAARDKKKEQRAKDKKKRDKEKEKIKKKLKGEAKAKESKKKDPRPRLSMEAGALVTRRKKKSKKEKDSGGGPDDKGGKKKDYEKEGKRSLRNTRRMVLRRPLKLAPRIVSPISASRTTRRRTCPPTNTKDV